ncbi:MAG TPA: hypothetical protein DCX07_14035 [Phycisphaerales bacterium]|nr:hypothetical protein [Phycisphaerales bacterium]
MDRTGFYPFWFWNDRLDPEEIRWQIAQLAKQDMKGFYICPRQGLGQPYLSEAFFQMVGVAIAEAEKLGLEVHLCDEYPYPSGAAGGEVTLGNPAYYATYLTHQTHDVVGPHVRLMLEEGKVLSIVAYPLDGETVNWSAGIDLRHSVGVLQLAESYLETGLTRHNRKRSFTSRPTPVLEAQLPPGTFRIYASLQLDRHRHKYFGHFVDTLNPEAVREFIRLTHERYLQRYGSKFGRTFGSIFVDETAPSWSARIPDEFRKQYGYDLLEKMPALAEPTHPEHSRVARDVHWLKYRLFCESFEEQVSRWCQWNGVAYGGEKPSLRLSQLRYMDIPGCEPGHTRAGDPMDLLQPHIRGNARATASAAYFYGKSGALCECYHSMGWGATLQDVKLVAEGLLLMGVRYLVPHALFYSTHGLRKHDAPPSFFFQMPYWSLWGRLNRRVERIASMFAGTHIDAQVLVVEPSAGMPSPEQRNGYAELLQRMMREHIEFLLVDTDILSEARIADGWVHARDVRANVVIVPPMSEPEPPLQQWLERFAKAGGKVVRIEAGDSLNVAPSLRVPAELQVVARRGSDKRLWFILNPTAQPVEMEIPTELALHEVPLDEQLPPMLREEGGRYRRTIRPFESMMLMAGTKNEPVLPVVKAAIDEWVKVRPQNANLLRMYRWKMSLGEQRAEVPAVPLAHQLEKGQFRYSPRVLHFFGAEPELTWPEMKVRYEFDFLCEYGEPVQLVMEPGSLAGKWAIFVNDAAPLSETDFVPATAHVRGSRGADVTKILRRGMNTIRVELTACRPEDGLLNALYLAGNFGVRLSEPALVRREENGRFEQYEHNGLPYYSGVLEYDGTFELPEMPSGDEMIVEFQWPERFGEACEVSINGGIFQPILWQPQCLKMIRRDLQLGSNRITIRVYTTLLRSFEGREGR